MYSKTRIIFLPRLSILWHFPRKPIGEQWPADEISPPHLRGRKLPQPGSVRRAETWKLLFPTLQGNQSFRSVAGNRSNGRAVYLGDPRLARWAAHLSGRPNPAARQLVRRFRDQAALRTGSGNARSGRAPSRRQASSSPFRRAPSTAAKASTPCGHELIPWCLQRADTAQSLYFSTRVLAIHNPARCRCW